MFVRRRIPWSWTIYYAWRSLLYFAAIATTDYLLRQVIRDLALAIPFEPVLIMGTALAIFFGFKNNEAYARWWEARKIWGLGVNFSRAWSRQVLTLVHAPTEQQDDLAAAQRRMIYRQIAFM